MTGPPGAVTLSLVQGNTAGLQFWDQARGKCVVETDDLTNFRQVAHDLICKGDWGDPFPLALSMRAGATVTGGAPYGNPAGLLDPAGITTPAPALLSTGTIL